MSSKKNATSLAGDVIEHAQNDAWDEMTLATRTTSLLFQYGKGGDGIHIFGSVDDPISLAVSDIIETKKCERCNH